MAAKPIGVREPGALSQDFAPDLEFARKMDRRDPLAHFRKRFFIPKKTIYMDGNSLGLLCREAEQGVARVIEEWKSLGIGGWLEAEQPWFYFSEELGGMVAPLVGAKANEVVSTGTTTVNLHSLVAGLYHPTPTRHKILADRLNFPSDIYALKGQLELKGRDPERDLILVPEEKDGGLSEERLVEHMTQDTALILLPSVLYQSGQLLDIPYLTAKAHEHGILIGFDCSHSVGAVPHRLHEWGVDFAMWCSYKYLNGGPGSSAFLYLHENLFANRPLLAGWFGSLKEKQFDFSLDFSPSPHAGGWQISSPGILSAAAVQGALGVINEAGIDSIREKSLRLTSYFIHLVDHLLTESPYDFKLATPRDPERRGGHVALKRAESAGSICQALKGRGVIPDHRKPDIIRIAPVALYSKFEDVWRVAAHLKEIIDSGEHRRIPVSDQPIT
jgi:kynureninase